MQISSTNHSTLKEDMLESGGALDSAEIVMTCRVILAEKLAHPNGSPTTRKATSSLSAPSRILSASDSTISRSATTISLP